MSFHSKSCRSSGVAGELVDADARLHLVRVVAAEAVLFEQGLDLLLEGTFVGSLRGGSGARYCCRSLLSVYAPAGDLRAAIVNRPTPMKIRRRGKELSVMWPVRVACLWCGPRHYVSFNHRRRQWPGQPHFQQGLETADALLFTGSGVTSSVSRSAPSQRSPYESLPRD